MQLILLGMLCSVASISWANDRMQLEKQILDDLLVKKKYDPTMRPPSRNGTEGPVVVKVNTYIRSISHMDDIKMEYNLQLTFRQEWMDKRLAFEDRRANLRYLQVTDPTLLWTPDTFFSNERKGHLHTILTPNVLLRIQPNGDVMFSIRVSLTLSCNMDLRNYPMDNQACDVVVASYAYTTDDIVYSWKDTDPVQVSKKINLPQFTFNGFVTENQSHRTSTGEYSSLKLGLHFSRKLNSYIVRMYIPHFTLVLLSWLPFWLHCHATTVRVAIWLTILLTMTVMVNSLQTTVPAVSYTKAIDVWFGICLTFVCAVVIQLVCVMQSVEKEETVRKAFEAQNASLQKPLMGIDDHAEVQEDSKSTLGRFKKWLDRYKSRAKRIDVISRFAFPLAFALFNLFYWSSYMASQ